MNSSSHFIILAIHISTRTLQFSPTTHISFYFLMISAYNSQGFKIYKYFYLLRSKKINKPGISNVWLIDIS
jgi:hypothetical protein